MADIVLPRGIKSVTFVSEWPPRAESESSAPGEMVRADKAEKKEKKQSRGLRVFGKWNRRWAEAMGTMAATYLTAHARSNQKKRDGWLRDYGDNVFKANRKALKRLRLFRV
jgi:hypothetical protein